MQTSVMPRASPFQQDVTEAGKHAINALLTAPCNGRSYPAEKKYPSWPACLPVQQSTFMTLTAMGAL